MVPRGLGGLGFIAMLFKMMVAGLLGGQFFVGGESPAEMGSLRWWIFGGISIFLVCFAGIMSGLTLGLMSLGLMDLEVLQRSGTDLEKKQASKIASQSCTYLVLFLSYWLFCLSFLNNGLVWRCWCSCCKFLPPIFVHEIGIGIGSNVNLVSSPLLSVLVAILNQEICKCSRSVKRSVVFLHSSDKD